MENQFDKLTKNSIGHMCQELEEINVPRAAITVAKTYMWALATKFKENVNVNVKGNHYDKENYNR